MHPIEALIKNKIQLSNKIVKGWNKVLCRVCNDHGKKGMRAGFRFDHDVVGYNCFNCGAKFKISHTATTISREAYRILGAYGVVEDEVNMALIDVAAIRGIAGLLGEQNKPALLQDPTAQNPPEIQLPTSFQILQPDPNSKDVWTALATNLLLERKIDPNSYPFMISPGDRKWGTRLIIPVFKDRRPIYFMGRDMLDQSPSKYINCDVTRENVLFGFDRLFEHTDQPLYVFEGIFDAMTMNGVAVLQNHMTKGQIKWLNKSSRRKVIVPDFKGDGHMLAEEGIQQGWQVAFPDIGSCKDINEAMCTFGRIFVIKSIVENTYNDFDAKMRVELLIKEHRNEKKK